MRHRLCEGILIAISGVVAARARTSTQALIARCRAAACLAPRKHAWHETVTLRDGTMADVNGSEMAGGRIDATSYSDRRTGVVANTGDYIYPSDVRFEPPSGRLYVIARGLAGAILYRSYLIEFDLHERRLLVKDREMPSTCPDAN